MKLTTIFLIGATVLNTVVCSFDLIIQSAAEIKDDIRIYGKNSSNGEVIEMSRALYNPSNINMDFCHNQTYGSSQECENNRPLYSYVENISFDSPTDQPRNLYISTPGYNLSVSS